MSAWKSRWSWVRLVNSATSKWIASARCSDIACEETSIAQARSPPSSIRAEGRLQVDRLRRRPLDLLLDPADHLLDGPQQPASGSRPPRGSRGRGRRSSSCRWCRSPPTTRSSAVGSPSEARRQRRHRRPRVGHQRPAAPPAPSSRSTTSAAAPAATAAGGEVVAVAFSPGTQKNSVPGPDPAAVVGERRRSRRRGSPTSRSASAAGDQLVQPHRARF